MHIELVSSGNEFEKRVVTAADLAKQIDFAGWLVREAGVQSELGKRRPRSLLLRRKHSPVRLEPVILQAHYGSPLSQVLEVPVHLLGNLAGLSLLIYGLKRLWGIDLELKTHREKQRRQFYEAQARAKKAQERASLATPGWDRKAKQLLERIDEDMDWEKGTAAEIEARRSHAGGWDGQTGTWLLND